MVEIEKNDNELYKATYGIPTLGDKNKIWGKIKENKEILTDAIKIVRDKFNEHNTLKGNTIVDAMLKNYDDIDEEIYNKLINIIYSDLDIARTVLDGYSNGGCSFLLMSLWNKKLKLTDKQKVFAVNEAMNKIGTKRDYTLREKREKELEKSGITDDEIVYMDFGGSVNPIGKKTASKYMDYIFKSISNSQAHGVGAFDIRYQILKNSNWTEKEKEKLVFGFYYDDKVYDEYLEEWEWNIINEAVSIEVNLEISDLYYYTYDEILEFCKNKKNADYLWNEIQFCKLMHKLRPQQWELKYKKTFVKKRKNGNQI